MSHKMSQKYLCHRDELLTVFLFNRFCYVGVLKIVFAYNLPTSASQKKNFTTDGNAGTFLYENLLCCSLQNASDLTVF